MQPLARHQGVADGPIVEDTPITQHALHPLFNPVTGEPGSAQSSSDDVILAEPNQVTHHLIFSEKVEPKNFKMVVTEDSWFEAMQNEIHEFDRLEVNNARDFRVLQGGDAAILEGQQRAAPVVETAMGEPLGLGYRALRRPKITLGEGRMPSVFELLVFFLFTPRTPVQTPPSPKWSSSLLLVSLEPSIVPSPISSPMIPLTVPLPVASPATAESEGFLTELGARVKMQGGLIRDHMI
ncbi:hypothetical protein Tco_1335686 [Tanacetum coccineum]